MTQSARPPSPESLLEHREWLRAIARRLVGDENAVDDVEQRVWLAVLRNRRPVASVRAWLRRVVRSAAVDEHRSGVRRHARESAAARDEALPPTDHLAAQADAQRAVAQAVTGLPEPYRTTVLLRYFEELPIDAVAARMGAPAETVRTRLRRAHALLRESLDREFGDRRAWALALLPLVKWKAPATAGGVATGVMVMAGTKKVVAAAALLVLLAGGAATWMTLRDADTGADAADVPAEETSAAADGAAAARTSRHPKPADAPIVSLTGRVRRRHDGLPVAAAHVVFVGADGRSVSECTTPADGTFRADDVPAASVRVEARGFRAVSVDVPRDPSGLVELGDVWLDASAALVVEVLGPRGAPVEGAEVEVVRRRAEEKTSNSHLRWLVEPDRGIERCGIATTDGAGLATFRGLAPGWYTARTRRAGLATTYSRGCSIAPGRPETRVTLRASEGHTLTGRVVTASGDPAPGCAIWILYETWDDGAIAATDAAGAFVLAGLPAGRTRVAAGRTPGRARAVAMAQVPVTTDVVLRFPPTGVVTGRIALADGSAVADAEVGLAVTLDPRDLDVGFYARTDADGRWRIEDVPAGPVSRFEARHAGLWHVGPRLAPDVEADRENVIDGTMARGARLHGRVLSADGPVAGADVCVLWSVKGEGQRWESAVTDDAGRYAIDALRPGAAAVVPSHAGYFHPGAVSTGDVSAAVWNKTLPPELLLDVPDGGDVERDFQMLAGSRIAGRVVSPSGEGVAEAEVRCERTARADVGTPVAVTDAAGEFVLARVAGPGGVKVVAESAALCPENVPEVTLDPAAQPQPVEIRMVPRPRVTGRVVDTSGAAVEGARISLRTWDSRQWQQPEVIVWTDPSGEYTASASIPAGKARVTASATGRGEAHVSAPLAPETRCPDIVLGTTRGFAGRLVSPDEGLSFAGARIDFREPPPSPEYLNYGDPLNLPEAPACAAAVRADGSFDAPLAPGRWSATVSGPGLVTTYSVVEVPGRAPLDIAVRRAVTLSGTLRGDDGKPLVRARLVLDPSAEIGSEQFSVPGSHEQEVQQRGEHRLSRLTDAAGAFAFPGIPEGEYVLVAVFPGGPRKPPREVRFGPLRPSAGPHDLSLATPVTGSISGRVLDADGNAHRDAKVTLDALGERTKSQFGSATTAEMHADVAADGTYRIDGLTASSYTIRVHVQTERGRTKDGVEIWMKERVRVFRAIRVGTTDLVLKMTAGAVVRGRLVDEHGAPVAGRVVLARWAEGPVWQPALPTKSGRSGADGAFAIEDLEDAEYQLEIAGSARGPEGRIVAAPKVRGTADVGDLVFTLEARIRGRVVDKSGAAVAEARVDFWPEAGGRAIHVTADAEGAFEALGLEPGVAYAIWIAGDVRQTGASAGRHVVKSGAADVRLVKE